MPRGLFCWCDKNVQGSRYYMPGGMGGGEGSDVCFVNPSHDLQTFDSVCVHPSHDLHFWQCVHPPHDLQLHFWQCLCCSISWQYCYVLLLTVFVQPSHDLQTHLTDVFISWPADAFNSVCVLPSHDLQTLWQCLCSSISWPQTLLTVFVSIYLMTPDTFDSVFSISWPQTLLTMFVSIHLMTCRHIWQCVCPSHNLHTFDSLSSSISWPADTFDGVCVHPSYDLQTLLTVFVSIHLMTCRHLTIFVSVHLMTCRQFWQCFFTSIHLMTFRHFLRWALLSLDNTTFSFSIFYKLFPGYNLILMPLFCISGTMTKTRSPRVVPKFDDASESSRALVDDKESKTAADQRARNKLTS